MIEENTMRPLSRMKTLAFAATMALMLNAAFSFETAAQIIGKVNSCG